VPDFKLRGVQYLRNLAHRVFYVELSREPERPDAMRRPQVSPLATLFLDILPRCLARTDSKEITEAESLVAFIIEDLVAIGQAELASGAPRALDLSLILHALASRFAALCFEESFASKMAGFRGIVIMTSTVDLGKKWISDRELDFVRAFLSVLKDMPHEVPKVTEAILKALKDILTVCNAPAADDQPPVPTPSKLPYLIGVLILELPSSNAVVRRTAQIGIELLSQLSGKGITELLMPYRERLLLPIYGKPLRALPFQNQIGHIDAVTYALNLQPPIPEPNDELLRMLHESLALADADDQMLIPRLSQRHTSVAMIKLRVACIKLLTASLPVTDFFSKQGQTRQR
jgi:transformation/transcription domain-associated protein